MAVAQFSGIASGIDSAALIDAYIEAKEIQNDMRRDDISHLESENEALEELNTKLLALSDLLDPFRSVNGGGLDKKANSSDTTVATAIVGSDAPNASMTLTVSAIADTATQSIYYATGYSSTSDNFSDGDGSGDLTITIGQGDDEIDITVAVTDGTTTVADVVDAINNDENASGRVVATAVNTGTASSPDYEIVITTAQSGLDKGMLQIDTSAFGANVSKSAIDQATDSEFTIGGINGTITRSTNTVSDVISGVTFQLVSAGSTTITIGEDESSTADKVNDIVEAYNDIVEYINENDTVTRIEDDDDVDNVYGSLAKSRVDNDLLTQLRSDISTANSTSGSYVTSMSELGISTNRDGTLSFDVDEFKEKVGQDPVGAGEVLCDFADSVAGVSGSIYQYTKYQGHIDSGQESNNSEIENLNKAIEQLDRMNEKYRESLEKRFANLESVIGKLQNDQSALGSILASL